MEKTVTLYWGTGINRDNIPYNITSYLAECISQSVASVWMLQTRDTATIRLDATAITAGDIMDVDYIQAGEDYYYVDGVQMLSGMTAELSIVPDYINSIGGLSDNAARISGWVTRAHVAKADDTLFSNTIPEPYTPSAPLVITGWEKLTGDDQKYGMTLIAANVDLTQASTTEAMVYKAASEADAGGECVVPYLPAMPSSQGADTTAESVTVMPLPSGNRGRKIPATTLYDYNDATIRRGIQAVRSLGMEDTITASYVLPGYWTGNFTVVGPSVGGPFINEINGIRHNLTPSSDGLTLAVPGQAAYHNKKVSATLNNFVLLSMCSGDKEIFDAADLRHEGDTKPTFAAYSDPAPDGRPYCQPRYYDGTDCPDLLHAVQGETWQSAPLRYIGKSGSAIDTVTYRRKMDNLEYNYGVQKVQSGMQIAQAGINAASNALSSYNPLGIAAGMVGAVKDIVLTAAQQKQALTNTAYNIGTTKLDYQISQHITVPEIAFPQSESLQNYVGNGFYLYRICMSPADCKRLDDYLTMYGYAQDKPYAPSDLTNRKSYNYIKMSDVHIANTGLRKKPRRYIQGAEEQLSQGIRVWHTTITADLTGVDNA